MFMHRERKIFHLKINEIGVISHDLLEIFNAVCAGGTLKVDELDDVKRGRWIPFEPGHGALLKITAGRINKKFYPAYDQDNGDDEIKCKALFRNFSGHLDPVG